MPALAEYLFQVPDVATLLNYSDQSRLSSPSPISNGPLSPSPFTRPPSISFASTNLTPINLRRVKPLSDESELPRLLNDHSVRTLAEFIPLGCLQIPGTYGHLPYESNEIFWHEIGDADETGHLILQQCKDSVRHLLKARWIRLFFAPLFSGQTTLRVYALPEDVGQRVIDRNVRSLRMGLEELIKDIDVSPATWLGKSASVVESFDPWATGDHSSLYYIYNTLPSPSPSSSLKSDRFTLRAIQGMLGDVNHTSRVTGLKTTLYPYQARSAAVMIERESMPRLHLDPRLEPRTAPDGSTFYYSPRDAAFFRSPRNYESIRGGILAETMGLGKTIICLAVILATRHTLPRVPVQYEVYKPVQSGVPSLMKLAISKAARSAVPIKAHFDRLRRECGDDFSEITRAVDDNPVDYLIPQIPIRTNRRTQIPPPRRMRLCSGTIVVVPANLVNQWRLELKKHVELRKEADIDDGGLHVLVMDKPTQALPDANGLMKYDVILFSKTRFQREIYDGSDKFGRTPTNVPAECKCPYIGATRIKDCSCLKIDDLYSSPLKQLHWLRIIIDEGHEFTSSSSNAVIVADRLVTAERRWIVSGTPAKERLFGVEIDLAALADAYEYRAEFAQDGFDDAASLTTGDGSLMSDASLTRLAVLDGQKPYNRDYEVKGAARNVGIMASNFLKVRPWAESNAEGKAEWVDHIYRHESFRDRTYSAFSSCLRRTLEALVVKTQPDDVERDIVLPPLEHNVIYLEPSFYDKLTANLFILFLTANAVTSERTDVDYLFHKNSAKARYQLITNLRQSNFFWTGFSAEDIESVIGHSARYLEKTNTKCTPEDRQLLQDALTFASMVLSVNSWEALSKTHELGLFIDQWPDSTCSWSLNQSNIPHMIGVTQLSQAQRLVNEQLFDDNPTEGLGAAGVAAVIAALETNEDNAKKSKTTEKDESKMGVPSSGLHSEPSAAKRQSMSARSPTRHRKGQKERKLSTLSLPQLTHGTPTIADGVTTTPNASRTSDPVSPSPVYRKRKRSLNKRDLPYYSPLALTSIVGTTSAKLSYLLTRITELYESEKILVFYDGDNTAYYIAQALEILHIKHLIYAKSLASDLRSKYIVTFDADPSIRVLLMDIRCGALGLNVNKASRVFFVNPVCAPSIEAQAIKRSHRIGQDKPVYVETLVLKGTIEEQMFERARHMSRREHEKVGAQLSDDQGIASIIQNAHMIPIHIEDGRGRAQMAKLAKPLQIFGRKGRGDTKIKGIDLDADMYDAGGDEHEVGGEVGGESSKKKVKKNHDASRSKAGSKPKTKRADFKIDGYASTGQGKLMPPPPTVPTTGNPVDIPVWKLPATFSVGTGSSSSVFG